MITASERRVKMFKVWSKRDPRVIFCIACETMDEAYAEARKYDLDATQAQMCTEDEAHQIKFGC